VQALVTTPGEARSTRVEDVPEPEPGERQLLVRTLEVGVCGTDREISEGRFGVPAREDEPLVLGHEFLGRVERDGHGFAAGDLVTATVRRTCGHCDACAQDAPDACLTGDYVERGITRLDGFARELVAEDAHQLIAVPEALGRLGVLAEPSSICARALRHARVVGDRQPRRAHRALVLGPGAIGMLAALFLRLDGFEVWIAGRSRATAPKAQVAEGCGARYVSLQDTPVAELAAELGGFDVVVEATGDAQVMADTLGFLGRNGVSVLLGIDGRPRTVSVGAQVLAVDAILQNRALLGSVNANRVDWEDAVQRLDRARERWPGLLDAYVDLRVAPDRFGDAFAHRGVKATLDFTS